MKVSAYLKLSIAAALATIGLMHFTGITKGWAQALTFSLGIALLVTAVVVAYRQAWQALDAGSLSSLRDAGIAATRQLAKRQITWLRSMPQRHVIACDAPDALAQVLAAVQPLQERAR